MVGKIRTQGRIFFEGVTRMPPKAGGGGMAEPTPFKQFFFANLTHLHKEPQPSTEPSKKIHLFFCRWPLGVTDFRGELAIVCESFPCKIIGHLPTCPWEAIPIIRMRFPDGVRKI